MYILNKNKSALKAQAETIKELVEVYTATACKTAAIWVKTKILVST